MTKQRVQNGSPPLRDPNAVQRVALALELRMQKVKYEDIALRCGYGSAGAAHKAIMRELERVVVSSVDELRREEAESLDLLEHECWKRLYDGDYRKSMLFAVDRIIQIKERRAKLMGLDTKVGEEMGPQIIIEEIPAGYLEGPKE